MKLEEQDNNKNEEVHFETEGDGTIEDILRSIIKGYQDAYNRFNEKNEILFILTLTTHKVATAEGNKDVAYLRLDRSIREKGDWPKVINSNPDGEHDQSIVDEGWSSKLVHQEAYVFRNLQERLNPNAPWKETLFMNALARLTSAGLEYAELLNKWKQIETNQKAIEQPKQDETEERLNKLGLVKANEVPMTLTKDEEDYKKWLAEERKKEGL